MIFYDYLEYYNESINQRNEQLRVRDKTRDYVQSKLSEIVSAISPHGDEALPRWKASNFSL